MSVELALFFAVWIAYVSALVAIGLEQLRK